MRQVLTSMLIFGSFLLSAQIIIIPETRQDDNIDASHRTREESIYVSSISGIKSDEGKYLYFENNKAITQEQFYKLLENAKYPEHQVEIIMDPKQIVKYTDSPKIKGVVIISNKKRKKD